MRISKRPSWTAVSSTSTYRPKIPAARTWKDRQVLGRADGADLSRYDEDEDDDSPAVRAALLVSSWVGDGKWSDHLAFAYMNDPLNYAGPGAPDRPTGIVTIMLPADVYDEFADVY